MNSRKVFNSEIVKGTCVLTPLRQISELNEEFVSDELKTVRQEFRDARVKNVVFDFKSIAKISSAMLEVLLVMKREIEETQGRIACCNLAPPGSHVLKLSRFDTFVAICQSREEALASVQQ